MATKFTNNSTDAYKSFQLLLHDQAEVAGLPTTVRQQAAQNYQQVTGKDASSEMGPWLITLAPDSYQQFMAYSDRRDLREKVYYAYVSAGHRAPFR